MAWTYGGDPAANSRDAVRFAIGDTETADQLVNDAEIAYALAENGNAVNAAAAFLCDRIAAKFARLADSQVDDVRVAMSQRAQGYRQMAADLRARIASSASVVLFAGGITISGKQAAEADTDRVPPIFTRDQHVVPPSGDDGEDDA